MLPPTLLPYWGLASSRLPRLSTCLFHPRLCPSDECPCRCTQKVSPAWRHLPPIACEPLKLCAKAHPRLRLTYFHAVNHPFVPDAAAFLDLHHSSLKVCRHQIHRPFSPLPPLHSLACTPANPPHLDPIAEVQ